MTADTITNVSFIYYLFNNFSASILMDEILLRLKLNILVLVGHVITYTECTPYHYLGESSFDSDTSIQPSIPISEGEML